MNVELNGVLQCLTATRPALLQHFQPLRGPLKRFLQHRRVHVYWLLLCGAVSCVSVCAVCCVYVCSFVGVHVAECVAVSVVVRSEEVLCAVGQTSGVWRVLVLTGVLLSYHGRGGSKR
jgi:hypothetical protein